MSRVLAPRWTPEQDAELVRLWASDDVGDHRAVAVLMAAFRGCPTTPAAVAHRAHILGALRSPRHKQAMQARAVAASKLVAATRAPPVMTQFVPPAPPVVVVDNTRAAVVRRYPVPIGGYRMGRMP